MGDSLGVLGVLRSLQTQAAAAGGKRGEQRGGIGHRQGLVLQKVPSKGS